ncbi:hypothetical protein [Variovorax sp. PAMC 28711]|uniref:hypothetical protein n=1 Tax=Variovorax sp. PAMC 28711 TaxID=1795631 RepID=UPI00078CB55A|nr:hypothetical protein [Variovorax sp. PAMC 28711]AMM23659.1 hypothetical protein AX767_04350 [Variovorax sp. PAMC 28711]
MQEIKFDLGNNIHETAKASGAPSFQKSETAGLIDYSVAAVPDTIPAHYTRAGYEIVWRPIFAFAMYADRDRGTDLRVETVTLQLSRILKTHEQAQAFVEQTLAQFNKGKWQRYSELEWYTLLTGRSSLLDEQGRLSDELMALDPDYKIPAEDWPLVVKKGPIWRWVGDGVIAKLKVNEYGTEERGLDYSLGLQFDLVDIANARDAEDLARRLKEGDAKGWNSTVEHEANKKKAAARIKRLEENAIQRGDSVVKRP